MPQLDLEEETSLGARVQFIVSPGYELCLSLHVLVQPEHHPESLAWATRTRAALPADLVNELDLLGRAFDQWLAVVDWFHRTTARTARPIREALAEIDNDPLELLLYDLLGQRVEHPHLLRLLQGGPLLDLTAYHLHAETQRIWELALREPDVMIQRVVRVITAYAAAHFDREWTLREPALVAVVAREAWRLSATTPMAYVTSIYPRLQYDEARRELVALKGRTYRFPVDALSDIVLTPSTFAAPHMVVGTADRVLFIGLHATPPASARPDLPAPDLLAGLKALADETRLRIYRAAVQRPVSTQELARRLGLAEPTVSRHLQVLKGSGLITARKEGGFVLYAGRAGGLEQLQTDLTRFLRE